MKCGKDSLGDSNMTTNAPLYEIPVERIDGASATLQEHSGEVLLVVNVASKCGLTPQYEGLEALQKKFSGARFSVLGFPANDFAGQEPGSNADIQQFCTTQFGVTFPMYGKIGVTGPDKHPLYRHLTTEKPETEDRDRMEATLRNYKMEPTAKPHRPWNSDQSLTRHHA